MVGIFFEGFDSAITPGGQLYAGTEGGIFTSLDSGTWSAVNSGLTVDAGKPPTAIAIDPAAPATIYAGLDGGGIFKTTNSGGVFKSANSGAAWDACATQPTDRNVLSLNMDAGARLYAGTESGVFVSTDGCGKWTAMSSGLP